jgi:hypothetical protein
LNGLSANIYGIYCAQACLVAAAAFNIGSIDALLRLLFSSKSGKLPEIALFTASSRQDVELGDAGVNIQQSPENLVHNSKKEETRTAVPVERSVVYSKPTTRNSLLLKENTTSFDKAIRDTC